jgi:hypothetical protein
MLHHFAILKRLLFYVAWTWSLIELWPKFATNPRDHCFLIEQDTKNLVGISWSLILLCPYLSSADGIDVIPIRICSSCLKTTNDKWMVKLPGGSNIRLINESLASEVASRLQSSRSDHRQPRLATSCIRVWGETLIEERRRVVVGYWERQRWRRLCWSNPSRPLVDQSLKNNW